MSVCVLVSRVGSLNVSTMHGSNKGVDWSHFRSCLHRRMQDTLQEMSGGGSWFGGGRGFSTWRINEGTYGGEDHNKLHGSTNGKLCTVFSVEVKVSKATNAVASAHTQHTKWIPARLNASSNL